MAADERDEQYLLRVKDKALAQRLTHLLRDDPAQRADDAEMELNFDGAPSDGRPPRPCPAGSAPKTKPIARSMLKSRICLPSGPARW